MNDLSSGDKYVSLQSRALKYRYMAEVYYLSASTEEVIDTLVMCV